MDLHANVTRRSVEHADAIVGFRTSPHVDLRETGQRGAEVMVRMVRDGVRPAMAMVKIPMVVPASTICTICPGRSSVSCTLWLPLRVVHCSRRASLPSSPGSTSRRWGSRPSPSVTAISRSPENVAVELAELAWAERDAFMKTELVPIAEAIERAGAIDRPVILSDLADGTGAGSLAMPLR